MRKITIISGSRAEYDLLLNLIKLIASSNKTKLDLIITGSHLSLKYGLTKNYIEKNILKFCHYVDLNIKSSSTRSISQSMSIGIVKFEKILTKIKPNLVVLLGDRYEIFSSAVSATLLNLPIAHFHGGELTEGTYDDYWRHSITKLSHLHFVSNDKYAKRVKQLGENKKYIYNVGGLGIDNIHKIKLLNKSQLQHKHGFIFSNKNILLIFHSATNQLKSNTLYFENILRVIYSYAKTNIFISYPGHDLGSDKIIKLLKIYSKKYPNKTYVFKNLGSESFLSLVKNVSVVIGNSSSGILEAPYLGTPTLNIGNRQDGRLKEKTIYDCSPQQNEISKKLNYIFRNILKIKKTKINNLYGSGKAAIKAFKILRDTHLNKITNKSFFDL